MRRTRTSRTRVEVRHRRPWQVFWHLHRHPLFVLQREPLPCCPQQRLRDTCLRLHRHPCRRCWVLLVASVLPVLQAHPPLRAQCHLRCRGPARCLFQCRCREGLRRCHQSHRVCHSRQGHHQCRQHWQRQQLRWEMSHCHHRFPPRCLELQGQSAVLVAAVRRHLRCLHSGKL